MIDFVMNQLQSVCYDTTVQNTQIIKLLKIFPCTDSVDFEEVAELFAWCKENFGLKCKENQRSSQSLKNNNNNNNK